MGIFNWGQKATIPDAVYSVMNDDHVELYQIVRELADGARQRADGIYERDVKRLHLIGIIRRLIDKASEHFRREDQLMDAYRYPEAKAHRSEHLMLLRSIEMSLSRLSAEGRPVTEEVVKGLKDWLTNHIRTTDRKLDRFLIAATRKGETGAKKLVTSDAPTWTPEASMLWASFNDAVSVETVSENRKRSTDAIQQMEERQRREQERQSRLLHSGRGREQARQMHAVYFE